MTSTDRTPGRDKALCGANKRGPVEGSCRRPAGWGTDHVGVGACKLHGGNTPSHRLAAERAQVAELADRYSVPRDVHPLEGVLEQYHRYAGQVAYLEARVNELPPESLFWGVESETDRGGGEDGGGFEIKRKAGRNALLEQFDRMQHEYARLGVEIVRIGLETARDSMAKQFGAQLQRLLDDLVVEFATTAVASGQSDAVALAAVFRARMVARVASFAGVEAPPVVNAA